MKNLVIKIFLAALILHPCSLLRAIDQGELKDGMNMHRLRAEVPSSSGWHKAESSLGNFEILMPFPFNDFTIKMPQKDGTVVLTHMVGAESSDKRKYSTTEFVQRPGTKFSLKEFPKNFERMGENVQDVEFFEYEGYSACQFNVSNGKMAAYQRVVVTEKGGFIMIIEFPESIRKNVEPTVDTFFDSLKLKHNKSVDSIPSKAAPSSP